MYKCCSVKRFFQMLLLDAIIFGMIFLSFNIGKMLFFTSADNSEEEIFLPVLMYHSICEKTVSEYSVTPEQIESDLKYLSNRGYTSVTAQELADYVYNGGKLPQKPFLLTLDDGFYNNLYYLEPILEKYDMTALVSVVGDFIERKAAADQHIPEYSYLTWEDINKMLSSGRFELGNHTYNMHSTDSRKGCKINSGENTETYVRNVNKDISLLQQMIKENTGTNQIVFTYPYGACCTEIQPVLRENGFLITLNCYEKPNYITREKSTLYGLNRYNRSGYYTTEEYMNKLLRKNM